VKTCQIFPQWFIALLSLGLLGGFVDAASGQPPSDTAPETAWQSAAIAHAQAMRSFRDSDNGAQPTPSEIPKLVADFDATGLIATYQPSGPTHTANNPFFQVLGTNERTCLTCREPQTGWSVSAQSVQARFTASDGSDPIFRLVDGATCPSDDVSTYAAKQQAFGLLLEKGLIRIGLPLPSSAEFIVEAVNDPYDCTTSPVNRSDRQLDRHCFGLSPSSSGNQYRLLEHDHVGWPRAEPGEPSHGCHAWSCAGG
jgi:hypothetical protein